MATPDIDAGLRSLAESLRQIKSLLAWQQLKVEEDKPHTPPSFRLDDHLEEDLRNQHGFFLKTAMDIRELLAKGKGFSDSQLRCWQTRLEKTEAELRHLNLMENFIKA